MDKSNIDFHPTSSSAVQNVHGKRNVNRNKSASNTRYYPKVDISDSFTFKHNQTSDEALMKKNSPHPVWIYITWFEWINFLFHGKIE